MSSFTNGLTANQHPYCQIQTLRNELLLLLGSSYVGIYLHGSLATASFVPNRSDIDVIIVVSKPLTFNEKKRAANILLTISLKPYPIELHVVCLNKLRNWHSSGPFEFHYSEHWRFSYEMNATFTLTKTMPMEDSDLTSHIKLLYVQGISIDGPPIASIFPDISDEEFLKIVQQEYQMCLTTMFEQPDYCMLTIIRFWVFKIDGSLITKQEAVQAGKRLLPELFHKLLDASFSDATSTFSDEGLQAFLQYVDDHIPS